MLPFSALKVQLKLWRGLSKKEKRDLLGHRVVDVLSDVASGLKTERKGLMKLFNQVVNRQVDVVVVTYRDRLTRFGFKYLEYFFKQYGLR
jgi:Predicted site-specific integrase-resolvase